jgi:hypothetical protein
MGITTPSVEQSVDDSKGKATARASVLGMNSKEHVVVMDDHV